MNLTLALSNATPDAQSAILGNSSNASGDVNVSEKVVGGLMGRSAEFKIIIDYLLLAILIVIMLSMGCEITWSQIVQHVKRPIGIGIGMASQFVIMPLAAFLLTQAISISGLQATGILIICCCPSGPLSNFFTYFSDGDLSLSVAMTSFSTLLAIGMMPFNMWAYGRNFETDELVIPYSKLVISLVSVTSPVAVGILLRWKARKIAAIVTKIGSYTGILLVVLFTVFEVIVFPNMFTDIPSKLYAAVFIMPMIGVALGFLLSLIFRQPLPIRKTIAIECGVQNVPTALTIISLSFADNLQEDLILLPWIYGFAMVTSCSVICVIYQIYKRLEARRAQKEKLAMLQEQAEPMMCREPVLGSLGKFPEQSSSPT